MPRADRKPGSFAVLHDIVGRRQGNTFDRLKKGGDGTVALKSEYAALGLAQIREQKTSVRTQSNSIGFKRPAPWKAGSKQALAAVGQGLCHAAAPVRRI